MSRILFPPHPKHACAPSQVTNLWKKFLACFFLLLYDKLVNLSSHRAFIVRLHKSFVCFIQILPFGVAPAFSFLYNAVDVKNVRNVSGKYRKDPVLFPRSERSVFFMIKDTRVVKDAVYLIDDNSMRSRSDVRAAGILTTAAKRPQTVRKSADFTSAPTKQAISTRIFRAAFGSGQDRKSRLFPQLPPLLRRRFLSAFFKRRQKEPSRLKLPQKTVFSASAARRSRLLPKTRPIPLASNLTLTAKKPSFPLTTSITAHSN